MTTLMKHRPRQGLIPRLISLLTITRGDKYPP